MNLHRPAAGKVGERHFLNRSAAQPGQFVAPHGLWVDDRGDIYMAEVTDTIGVRSGIVTEGTHTFQKFARI